MATDKEHSTNDEVNRSDEFQKRVDLKSEIIDFLKEALISVTDSVFEKSGFKKNTKSAGEYGDGTKYGAGAVEDQYTVLVAGKTKSFLTKKIIFDGKFITSEIEMAYKDNVVEFIYKTTEQGFFRGVDKDKKTYTVNEKFSLDGSNMTELKNALKSKLKSFAEKEFAYITNTKLGVSDKTDKSTSSVVENITQMKKLTIKELYEADFGLEDDNLEPNSDKIKDLNTLDLKDTNPPINSDKKLFFDDAGLNETGEWDESDSELTDWKNNMKDILLSIQNASMGVLKVNDVRGFDKYQGPYAMVTISGQPYKIWTSENGNLWIENYPIDNTSAEGKSAGFEGNPEEILDIVTQNKPAIAGADFSMNEITTAGPAIADSPGGYKDGAQSGAGGYNTKQAWKKTPYAQNRKKKPVVTREYKVVPQNEEEEDAKSKSESSEKTEKAPKSETPKSNVKSVGSEKGDYKNTNQTSAPKTDNDGFWTEVDLNPGSGYVPKGMEKNYISGMHDASQGDLKKMGYAEGKKPDLTKKKFFSLAENNEKGINKRYLITEKTTDQYEKERWSKLANFKSRESIKEAEEMNEFFDSIQEQKDPEKTFVFKRALKENISYDDMFDEPKNTKPLNENINSEETIEVEKPGSKFGLTYKFFKKDFINENKHFILDLNSHVYVPNPNCKK